MTELVTFASALAALGSPLGSWVSVRTHPRMLLAVLALVVALSGVRIAWSAVTGE